MNNITYPPNTVYFISYAQLPDSISAKKAVGTVGLGMVIDFKTNCIIDISCTLITPEARSFLSSIIVGYDLSKGPEELLEIIQFRFNGCSQKSICVVVKDVYRKYMDWKIINKNRINN